MLPVSLVHSANASLKVMRANSLIGYCIFSHRNTHGTPMNWWGDFAHDRYIPLCPSGSRGGAEQDISAAPGARWQILILALPEQLKTSVPLLEPQRRMPLHSCALEKMTLTKKISWKPPSVRKTTLRVRDNCSMCCWFYLILI